MLLGPDERADECCSTERQKRSVPGIAGRKVEQPPPLQQTFPIAPHTLEAHAGESFKFEQPSPDDKVIAAQSGKPTPLTAQARGVQHVRPRWVHSAQLCHVHLLQIAALMPSVLSTLLHHFHQNVRIPADGIPLLLLLLTRPANAAPSEAAQSSIEGGVQTMRLHDEGYDGHRDSRTTHNGDASTSGRLEPDPQPQV